MPPALAAVQVTEPVAGNYYPITARATLADATLTLGVVTDRAQGAASLSPGQLEVMVARRTLVRVSTRPPPPPSPVPCLTLNHSTATAAPPPWSPSTTACHRSLPHPPPQQHRPRLPEPRQGNAGAGSGGSVTQKVTGGVWSLELKKKSVFDGARLLRLHDFDSVEGCLKGVLSWPPQTSQCMMSRVRQRLWSC